MARDCKSSFTFGSASCLHRRALGRFVGLLNAGFNTSFTVPVYLFDCPTDEARLASVKQFCSGLLGRCSHPWRSELHRFSRPTRFSVAMSLFLFRKTLPSIPPSVEDFLNHVSTPSEECDPGFLSFIRRQVPVIFNDGWDNKYTKVASSTVLTTSSCVQIGRKEGGCRMFGLTGAGDIFSGRDSFLESVLGHKTFEHEVETSRATLIEKSGKHRIITVPDGNLSLLRPLHTTMYNHLSKFDWLLRGEAKPSRFSDFVTREGEVFVSGDYESATDNLNNTIQREILRIVLFRSRNVPHDIQRLAMDSLNLKITDGAGHSVVQVRGQMMGNLLSFPLLCLVNYLAFKYFIRRRVPVRINGDDIVFRATKREADIWMNGVSASGLTLSKGKTMVDSRAFTLNSCLFYSERNRVRGLPFIRANSFFPVKDRDAIVGLKGRFLSFAKFFPKPRLSVLRVLWLRENSALIHASRRSLVRGLGLPLKLYEVMSASLWEREAWYLSFASERALPSPFSEWARRPDGYVYHRVEKITKEMRAEQEGLAEAFVDAAWKPPRSDDRESWERSLGKDAPNFSVWSYQRRYGLTRRSKLLHLSRRNTTRYLCPRRQLFHSEDSRLTLHGVWRPGQTGDEQSPTVPSRCDRTVIGSVSRVDENGAIHTAVFPDFELCDTNPLPIYTRMNTGSVPIFPSDELTAPVRGRTVVFRHGQLRGSVFKKNYD